MKILKTESKDSKLFDAEKMDKFKSITGDSDSERITDD